MQPLLLLRLLVSLFVAAVLVRLLFGEPLDRHFFVGFGGGAVALILAIVFVMPLPAPHVVSNRDFFAAIGRRLRGKGRDEDQ